MRKKLLAYKNKTISLDQLQTMAGIVDYSEFVQTINGFVEDKILEAVKTTGKNGRTPALLVKYRINKPESDYSSVIEEIKLLRLETKFYPELLQLDLYD